jgi:N6-L-threonylcarbamoyladenine synthase
MPLILGIESSCDETAAAIVSMGDARVLANVVASQDLQHAPYGGVVPEIASRQHLRAMPQVVRQALDQAGITIKDLSGVAVTHGPGLAGSLIVGLSYAKGLAWSAGLPYVGVDHLEGHLWAARLEHPALQPPFVALVVSGGHTSLYRVDAEGRRERLARTRDDAAGEAFDKVAKLLGLGYPGGPALARLADGHVGIGVRFPISGMKDRSLDFSFSGLKTAVLWHVRAAEAEGLLDKAAVASGFQEAVVEALAKNTLKAMETCGIHSLVLGGGVASNKRLRQVLSQRCEGVGAQLFAPSPSLCTDNAAMIALCGGWQLLKGHQSAWDLPILPTLRQL